MDVDDENREEEQINIRRVKVSLPPCEVIRAQSLTEFFVVLLSYFP